MSTTTALKVAAGRLRYRAAALTRPEFPPVPTDLTGRDPRSAVRPPRIALFSGNYNYVRDGANQALNRLTTHLENRLGATVRVYSPTTSTPAFEPAGELVSVPSIGIPGRSEYRLALGMTRRIRGDVERFDPDIVHVSAPDILGTAASNWARARSIPVIASLHTRFETYFAYYGLRLAEPLATRHLARFYARSDFVLVPSPRLLEAMSASRSDGRVRLWSRGVDHDLFTPGRRNPDWRVNHGYRDDNVIVMFFGRLVLEKGVDLFAQVIRRLCADGAPVRPLIVGDGPARERMLKDLPGAVFTGHLEGEALARAVASADIMLMPSTTEAFGNVVVEAMASGIVVVCADTPIARHLIKNGETGILCEPLMVDDYAAAVRELSGSTMRRSAIGAAARRASLAHDWTDALDEAVETYSEALSLAGRIGTPRRSVWRQVSPRCWHLENAQVMDISAP
jgi:phosphatidylinositol alpha 1,6-mannosyltransferase